VPESKPLSTVSDLTQHPRFRTKEERGRIEEEERNPTYSLEPEVQADEDRWNFKRTLPEPISVCVNCVHVADSRPPWWTQWSGFLWRPGLSDLVCHMRPLTPTTHPVTGEEVFVNATLRPRSRGQATCWETCQDANPRGDCYQFEPQAAATADPAR